MRKLFEEGKIKEAIVGDYRIILLPSGCFQCRQIKTGFLSYESSSTATYESVSKWCLESSGI